MTREAPSGTRRAWRALVLPTLSFLLGTTAQTTFLFLLVPAYARAHGLGKLELVAFAASALATTAVAVPSGRLADRVPRRRVFRLGWALEGVSLAFLAVAPPGVGSLLLAALGTGAGLGFGYVGFQSYVADVLRGAALANGYGATSAFAMLGSALGPFAGGAVLAAMGSGDAGVRAVAALLAAVAFAGALASFLLPTMRAAVPAPAAPPRVGFSVAVLQAFDPRFRRAPDSPRLARAERRSLLAYAAVFALLGAGYGLTVPWMGPRLLDHHALPASSWGVLLGVATALGALAAYAGGRAAGRRGGALPVAAWTNALVAASLVAFAFAPALAVASGAFLARQLFGNLTSPVLSAGLMQEVSEETRGRSFGLMNLAWNLPWALGAGAGGALLASLGGWAFVVGAAVVAAGPLVGLAVAPRGEMAERRPRRHLLSSAGEP